MKTVTLPILNTEEHVLTARTMLSVHACYTHTEAIHIIDAFIDNEPEAFSEILSGSVKSFAFTQSTRPSGERIWTLRVAGCMEIKFRSEPVYVACPCCGDTFQMDGQCEGCEAAIAAVFGDPEYDTAPPEHAPVIVSPAIHVSEIVVGDEIVIAGYAAEVVHIEPDPEDPTRIAFEIEGSDPHCPGDKYEPSYTRRFFRDRVLAVTPATFSVFEERRADRIADAIVDLGMWADFPRLAVIERAARRLAARNGVRADC